MTILAVQCPDTMRTLEQYEGKCESKKDNFEEFVFFRDDRVFRRRIVFISGEIILSGTDSLIIFYRITQYSIKSLYLFYKLSPSFRSDLHT